MLPVVVPPIFMPYLLSWLPLGRLAKVDRHERCW
jgi:hypothetical protein